MLSTSIESSQNIQSEIDEIKTTTNSISQITEEPISLDFGVNGDFDLLATAFEEVQSSNVLSDIEMVSLCFLLF